VRVLVATKNPVSPTQALPLTHIPSFAVWHVPAIARPFFHLRSALAHGTFSIREFCALTMPIFMHDNDGKYVVKTLEEVGFVFDGVAEVARLTGV